MSIKAPSIAFIICSEKGLLEKKSVLFVKSLRAHAGTLKDAPIYSICPRKGYAISASTKKSFKELKVSHQNLELNNEFKNYGLANKILACSYFEKKLDEELLVFCDSDLLILGSIDELLLDKKTDIAIQKVAQQGIGSTGSDSNASYWQNLFTITDVKSPPFISLPNGEKIYSYYNSGLISVRKSLGLFGQWENNFRRVIKKNLLPKRGPFFIEQSVLSATISSMQLKVKTLPTSYNFNFLKQTDSNDTFQKVTEGKIKILHYHKSFDETRKISLPNKLNLSNSSILQWINNELINCGINSGPFVSSWEAEMILNKQKVIGLFKKP